MILKEKICPLLLLGAIPCLMFCIIPVHGMEFRFSWQLASIWLGGVAFCAILSSWWLRAFFLLALIRTATMEPIMDAYMSLIMIAIFLAAIEGFTHIDERKILACICIAAGLLLIWMSAQEFGLIPKGEFAGPFNRDAAGVFLALCLPAFFHKKRWYVIPFVFLGIAMIGTSTGFIAGVAAIVVAGITCKEIAARVKIIMMVIFCIIAGLWFWKIDNIKGIAGCVRWTAWKHAAWSMRSEMFGRGLGSWKIQFPLLASGDQRMGTVISENGKITMSNIMQQAHNEYVQTGFELGIQSILLIYVFLITAAWAICNGGISPHAAGGLVALAISCFGWHVFHIPPLALIGCAWIGIWMKGE